MLPYSSARSARRGFFSALIALFLCARASAYAPLPQSNATPPQSDTQPTPNETKPPQTDSGPTPRSTGNPPKGSPGRSDNPGEGPKETHPPDTNPGRTPHSSPDGPAIASSAIGAAFVVGAIIEEYRNSPTFLGNDGPQIPKAFDMAGFAVKGLAYPGWPIVLDFMLDSPGTVQMDVVSSGRPGYRYTMTNVPNQRAYTIVHLPASFGTHLETALYRIRSIPAAGSSDPPPRLRIYGLGAGEKAVGSVAIDQLTFQPPAIHPRANEVANYGFHAHSAFDGVRAEFMFTTLYNNHVLVQKDSDAKLSPIAEGERARETWRGNGKPGEHLLQVRAWRGLENGGDWVVAWSPDIVDVVK
jgi:hypothetical protein